MEFVANDFGLRFSRANFIEPGPIPRVGKLAELMSEVGLPLALVQGLARMSFDNLAHPIYELAGAIWIFARFALDSERLGNDGEPVVKGGEMSLMHHH